MALDFGALVQRAIPRQPRTTPGKSGEDQGELAKMVPEPEDNRRTTLFYF